MEVEISSSLTKKVTEMKAASVFFGENYDNCGYNEEICRTVCAVTQNVEFGNKFLDAHAVPIKFTEFDPHGQFVTVNIHKIKIKWKFPLYQTTVNNRTYLILTRFRAIKNSKYTLFIIPTAHSNLPLCVAIPHAYETLGTRGIVSAVKSSFSQSNYRTCHIRTILLPILDFSYVNTEDELIVKKDDLSLKQVQLIDWYRVKLCRYGLYINRQSRDKTENLEINEAECYVVGKKYYMWIENTRNNDLLVCVSVKNNNCNNTKDDEICQNATHTEKEKENIHNKKTATQKSAGQ